MVNDDRLIAENLMENGEVVTTYNSKELSELVDLLFDHSDYLYRGIVPNLEYRDLYRVSYSSYVDGKLDEVYIQYWWDGYLLIDSLMTGRTSKLSVTQGVFADVDEVEDLNDVVLNDCVFYILTEIHNEVYGIR